MDIQLHYRKGYYDPKKIQRWAGTNKYVYHIPGTQQRVVLNADFHQIFAPYDHAEVAKVDFNFVIQSSTSPNTKEHSKSQDGFYKMTDEEVAKLITFTPVFTETVLPRLKGFFAPEFHKSLEDLVTGKVPSTTLIFNDTGQHLVEFFKRLRRNRLIASNYQYDIAYWICRFFLYTPRESNKGPQPFELSTAKEYLKSNRKEGLDKNGKPSRLILTDVVPYKSYYNQ